MSFGRMGVVSRPSTADSGAAYIDTIWYGQSNLLGHISTQSSPPAAAAGTQVWDPTTSAWITPVGNGIREFLNAMTAATGLPCRAVYGGQSGVPIGALQKGSGDGHYETLMARVVASGIVPDYIIIHHGEGNGNLTGQVVATHQAALDTLHGSISADVGKTRATCPMVLSSLSWVTQYVPPADSWGIIQTALATINAAYPNIYYSHSNMDAVQPDGGHQDGTSYGRSGARYAHTVKKLLGSVATDAKWFATAAERVTATTTRLTVVHSMGTDFTPTTGITGFELSGNNGASWVSGTGAREDATHILVTHADLGTTERKVRYQYDAAPNVTAPAKDNGTLAVPLNFTPTTLVAAAAAAAPTLTYISSLGASSSGVTQTHASSFTVAGGSEALLAVVGITHAGGANFSSCSVTAQPSGTVIAATLVESHGTATDPRAAIFQAQLPVGTTSITVSVTYSANPFISGRFHVSTIPVANLSSTTKTGSGKQLTAASTTSTTTLATSAGGCVFVVGINASNVVGNPGAFSGTETYVHRNNISAGSRSHDVGDSSNTSANAASSVTVTYAQSANTTIVAASWR